MYPDDTAILLSSKSIGDLQTDLNLDLLKLQDWLHANKLSLNVVKKQSLIGSGPNLRRIEGRADAPPSFDGLCCLANSETRLVNYQYTCKKRDRNADLQVSEFTSP